MEKMTQALGRIRNGMRKSKEGLPEEAFAIVGDPNDPETWKLPHHSRAIFRALAGKLAMESTVDWDRMPAAVAALSPGGYRGQRVEATLGQILHAARHLAAHYRKAGKDVSQTLVALIG
jgi:phosphoglycerate dehydrogenase-like enzyme